MDTLVRQRETTWTDRVIRRDEVTPYLTGGRDFIDDAALERQLAGAAGPDAERVRDILQKSLAIQSLTTAEAATLLNVTDPSLWEEMRDTAARVKTKVYDNRVVTFAPLYCSDLCVNNCLYCGFRAGNGGIRRRCLTMAEVAREAEVLAGTIGHKRVIVVYGEHPRTGADYIAETMRAIYGVKVPTRSGVGQIRRLNVNAAPMSVADLALLKEAGLGTFQVFQETYHHETYARLHPNGTVKSDYQWRVTAMHRAMAAGIDDVGIGVLFGLHDWRFEVMGLVTHAQELEGRFGIGPHTVSFPRLTPALDTPYVQDTRCRVSDEDFQKIVCVLRLAVPYTGMIITARESPEIIRECIPMCTQRDASSRIGIGAYQDAYDNQEAERQQFTLGDTRSLDSVIRELADMGYITSFCTAGYRCGRTGDHIMGLLRSGKEGQFCKLNAVLTFREWLDDFATPETKAAGERIIRREIDEVRARFPEKTFRQLMAFYQRVGCGERDLYF